MALSGTLEDMSVVELTQFPYAGRKTGKLVVSTENLSTILFYDAGKLVHAENSNDEGFEVIVDLVGWEAGTFEFLPDITTDKRSIDLDLHRLIMQALKTRDERKFEDERRRMAAEAQKSVINRDKSRFGSAGNIDSEILKRAQKEFPLFRYIAVVLKESEQSVEIQSSLGNTDYGKLKSSIQRLIKDYPNGNIERLMIEDDAGVVSLMTLDEDHALITIADNGSSLGLISVNLIKLARLITSE